MSFPTNPTSLAYFRLLEPPLLTPQSVLDAHLQPCAFGLGRFYGLKLFLTFLQVLSFMDLQKKFQNNKTLITEKLLLCF